ncbi:slipin family protein [Alloiococcus sp. CFN-8]|uniref:slipin family protein n=1 Tax=Alloiococcus sp. CFN-8 TaxID=3416081 RepID=UPI003CF5BCC8
MKIIINENQRGLLFKKGKFIKMLEAGSYYTFGSREIKIMELDEPVTTVDCSLDTLLKNESFAENTQVVEVGDEELALHFVNGKFSKALKAGRYCFWSVYDKHEFKLISIKDPEVSEDIPRYIFGKILPYLYTRVDVEEYQVGRLYYDNKLIKFLGAGTYYFWNGGTKVTVGITDMRMTKMDIAGQEILTKDKVTLRVNFVCSYKITDHVKVLTEIDNYKEQLHLAAQLVIREYVGKFRIDEILENKEEISSDIFKRLKEKGAELYLDVVDAGIKDIILPGEIREIMNTVLIAEKKAQANVITRREEVASTRSLLNTAKLMDENKTLYKLKELEYLEKICENVGNISVSGGNLLGELKELIRAT